MFAFGFLLSLPIVEGLLASDELNTLEFQFFRGMGDAGVLIFFAFGGGIVLCACGGGLFLIFCLCGDFWLCFPTGSTTISAAQAKKPRPTP
jgi:hypothetical protein